MKTYRNLYTQIYTWDNLYRAYRKARKGKRSRPPAATFEFNQEANLLRLQRELLAKSYRPGSYYSFYIHEPKRRLISAAPFRDRVVHHALCNVIEPLFERSFIHDSYANRKGKERSRPGILRAKITSTPSWVASATKSPNRSKQQIET